MYLNFNYLSKILIFLTIEGSEVWTTLWVNNPQFYGARIPNFRERHVQITSGID